MQSTSLSSSLDRVRRLAGERFPTATAVLLAGSRATETAFPSSDFDIVVFMPALPQGAWREMIRFEDSDMELFIHDPQTLAYFCREIERPSGFPVLATMVAQGIAAVSQRVDLLSVARELCRAMLEQGPPPLDAAEVDARRYAITDLGLALQSASDETLASAHDGGRLIASASAIYPVLADFTLRTQARWSASGKGIPAALAALDPTLARRFSSVFAECFSAHTCDAIQLLVEELLAPYGGKLREGYKQHAPAAWRDPG